MSMKSLPKNQSSQPEWDNKLVANIDYIKKNLRYPLRNAALLGIVLPVMVFILFGIAIWSMYQRNVAEGKNNWVTLVIFIPMVIILARMVKRAYGTTRFITVTTGYNNTKNMEILQQFLEAQNLIVFRHPDARDVFQIISKNIDAFKDVREILVFITDDNRILINSHFTSNLPMTARHHKEMAKMLEDYIKS